MNEENKKNEVDNSRRGFIKKLAYIPPAIMTLKAVPSYATTGSSRCKDDGHDYDGYHDYDGNHNYDGGSKYSGSWGWFR